MDAVKDVWKNLLEDSAIDRLKRPKEEERPVKRHKGQKPPKGKVNVDQRYPELLKKMAQLVVRHEDSLQAQLSEQQFMLHFNTGQGSIVPLLMDKSRQWHLLEKKETPLRHVLAQEMIDILHARLTKLSQAQSTDDLIKDCQKYHIVDSNQLMPFLQWCPKSKHLVPTTQKALSIQQVLRNVENLQRLLMEPATTLRFHALKKPEASQGPIPWLWMVSTQHNQEIYHSLREMSWHSAWQLIQVRLKPQGVQRSQLAQEITQLLRDA